MTNQAEDSKNVRDNRMAHYPVGARVSAGQGEDHDTGQIVRHMDGKRVFVSWDSGVATMAHIDDLCVES